MIVAVQHAVCVSEFCHSRDIIDKVMPSLAGLSMSTPSALLVLRRGAEVPIERRHNDGTDVMMIHLI